MFCEHVCYVVYSCVCMCVPVCYVVCDICACAVCLCMCALCVHVSALCISVHVCCVSVCALYMYVLCVSMYVLLCECACSVYKYVCSCVLCVCMCVCVLCECECVCVLCVSVCVLCICVCVPAHRLPGAQGRRRAGAQETPPWAGRWRWGRSAGSEAAHTPWALPVPSPQRLREARAAVRLDGPSASGVRGPLPGVQHLRPSPASSGGADPRPRV